MFLYDPTTGQWYEQRTTTTTNNATSNNPVGFSYGSYGDNNELGLVSQTSTVPLASNQSAPSEGSLKLVPGGKAATNYANLTRAQWQDYQRRFVPIEDELINSTSYANPEVLTKAIGQGREAVNKSFDLSSQNQNRAIGQYGITQDPSQIALKRRMEGLNRSAAIVDAANRIRQRVSDRNREITAGASPSSGIQMQGDQ